LSKARRSLAAALEALALAAALLAGSFELHGEHGLAESSLASTVFSAGCRSAEGPHLEASGPEIRQECPACLHRLQVLGGHLCSRLTDVVVAPRALRAPASPFLTLFTAALDPSAPRGPPAS